MTAASREDRRHPSVVGIEEFVAFAAVEFGADRLIQQRENGCVVVRHHVHIENAEILGVVEISVAFGSGQKTPAAVLLIFRLFAIKS